MPSDQELWKELLWSAKALEKIYLWNIVITDAHLNVILANNPLVHLSDVRIGSSEIGFIRLSEETALRLVEQCPKLRSMGGVCDWNVRDLLSLLHQLMMNGGWKMTLEPQLR